MGVVTSAVKFFRGLGGSFGVAAFGAVFASLLADRLTAFLSAGVLSGAALDAESLSASPERLRALPADLLAPTVRALSESRTAVFSYTVPVVLAGFALAFLPGLPLRDTIEGAELADGDIAAAPAVLSAAAATSPARVPTHDGVGVSEPAPGEDRGNR